MMLFKYEEVKIINFFGIWGFLGTISKFGPVFDTFIKRKYLVIYLKAPNTDPNFQIWVVFDQMGY